MTELPVHRRYVSFTRMRDLFNCPRLFRANYIDEIEPEELGEEQRYDCTDTLIGYFTQAFFELFITNKWFDLKEGVYQLQKDKIKILEEDCKAVMERCVKSIYSNKTVAELGGLTTEEPEFLELLKGDFWLKHQGSKADKLNGSSLSQKIAKIAIQARTLFERNFKSIDYIDWGRCKTEVKITGYYKGFKITGYIDFLVENEDGSILIADGKYNKNLSYAEPLQMQLYAKALGYEKFEAVLINYKQEDNVYWEFNGDSDIDEQLDRFIDTLNSLEAKNFEKRTPCVEGSVSGYCKYCILSSDCEGTQEGFKKDVSDTISEYNAEDLSEFL